MMNQINKTSYNLAVFDWNGTLLDDLEAIVAGDNAERAIFGLAPSDIDSFRQNFKIPISKFYEGIGISPEEFSEKSEAGAKAFHEAYEPLVENCSLRPGALELLNYLKNNGFVCIILSNHTHERISFHLNRMDCSNYFETILANDDIHSNHFVGKSGRLKTYLEETGQDPSRAFIVGDTIEETEIARELCLKSISITGGFGLEERLITAKPDIVIHNLADIVDKIKEL
jgi:phosphoglycolate phosphatase